MSVIGRFWFALFIVVSSALPVAASTTFTALLALNRNAPEHVIHSFQGNTDGSAPQSALIADQKGVLYGTTASGGGGCQGGCGTVFRFVPNSAGGYTEHIIHRFVGQTDGTTPQSALVADSSGALYGTTVSGGNACFIPGCGAVYKLTPQSGGGFRESVIYAFTGSNDGTNPAAAVLVDPAGNLIGTAAGGSAGDGVVFMLKPANGTYRQTVLHAFGAKAGDGMSPSGPLIADAQGNLYGLTANGGASGFGTVFELSPSAKGYDETILYSFTGGADGASPTGPLAFGPGGVLYGTAYSGGTGGRGTVFALTPAAKNAYAMKTIQRFTTLGAEPAGGVYVDPMGVLYGTTEFGGLPGCTNGGGCGIVFSLTPSHGGFAFNVLHIFGGGRDGSQPAAGLIPGANGTLFGTTLRGGTDNAGTVYRIK